MDNRYRCMGCMSEQQDFSVPCPHCGHVDKQNANGQLPVRSLLYNTYIIGKTLGVGGFGITYIGFDVNLLKRVCIKEFFLNGISSRNADGYSVDCNPQYSERFFHEKNRFIEEARVLAQLDDQPGVVKVLNYFEANQTAYIVMDYVEGQSLRAYVHGNGGRLSSMDTFSLLRPVIKALATMHSKGIVHLDISPSNIMLTGRGVAKLIDFGAAKGSNKDLNADKVYKKTYSPIEQRTMDGQIGTYSDVYAICATIYELITGQKPVGSMERKAGAPMYAPSMLGVGISPEQEQALMSGLAIEPSERIQSAVDLYYYLYASEEENESQKTAMPQVNNMANKQLIMDAINEEKLRQKKSKGKLVVIFSSIAAVLVALILVIVLVKPFSKKDNKEAMVTEEVVLDLSTTEASSETTQPLPVDSDDDQELRYDMLDLINAKRNEEGQVNVNLHDKSHEIADDIAYQGLLMEYTKPAGSVEWNDEIQIYVQDRLQAAGLSGCGWLVYVAVTTDKETMFQEINDYINKINGNLDGAKTLMDCNNIGLSVKTTQDGKKIWCIIYW